jgi:hypothetical protein
MFNSNVDSSQPVAETAPHERPASASAWYGLAILVLVAFFAFVDRQIIILLTEPIRHDFALSDTQIGLLQGVGVALFAAARLGGRSRRPASRAGRMHSGLERRHRDVRHGDEFSSVASGYHRPGYWRGGARPRDLRADSRFVSAAPAGACQFHFRGRQSDRQAAVHGVDQMHQRATLSP